MKGWHKAAITALVALLLLAVVSPFLPQPVRASPDPSWWNTDWGYRKKLTLDNSGQAENLVNFPALVKLTPSNFTYANCESDGKDIRFVDADDSTTLDYHFEQWTYNSTSWIWVEVPQIDGGSATDYIWLYYGNSAATPAQDEPGTYDANFMAVWHLRETAGGAGAIKDSTNNNNDGTDNGSPTFNASGQIDNAIDFDGIDDSVTVPDSDSLDLANGLTIEAWINIDSWGNGEDIVFKGGGNASDTDYQFALVSTGFVWDGTFNGSWRTKYFNTTQDTSEWIYAVITHNTATVKCYRDGSEIGSQSDPGNIYESTYQLGISQKGAAASGYIDGTIDEVRISNVARSADWIKAQYLSMNDAFITYSDIVLTGWGWCPDEERGIGDVHFPVSITEVPRGDAPEVSDIRFVGTLTLTYPDTTVRTFSLNLTGVRTRSIFYLMQHELDINGEAWGASFNGAWLTWNESGVDQHYLTCEGDILLPHGDVWTTVKPYFFLLRTPDIDMPELVEPDGDYADTMEYIIGWLVRVFDNLLTELSATNFWDILGNVLDRATVIIKEVRNQLVPYIP